MTSYRHLTLSVSLLLASAVSGRGSTNNWPNNLVSGSATFRGQPLAGVTVAAWNTNTNSITQVTATDESGNYTLQLPAAVSTGGIPMDYHIWAIKPGYGFYPSVGPGATVMRADHTGDFQGNGQTDIAIYFTVVHYQAIPNLANRGIPGPPVAGVNFIAYDGTNPLVKVAPDAVSLRAVYGAQPRFIDNNDGTITDTTTGLTWLKDAGCLAPSVWAAAIAEVNALANGTCGLADGSVAGDWRLPNLNELESLIDVSAKDPALPRGQPFTNVSNAIYWSSTSYFGGEGGSPNAWSIRLSDGRFMNDSVSNSKLFALNSVWAVKGTGSGATQLQSTGMYVNFTQGDDATFQSGVPLTFPRFLDKGDGTVADTVTGLIWLKQADCIHQTWTGAIAAARALANGQCGLTDGSSPGSWHVPTRNEMQSLSDRMENNHADFFNQTYLYRDNTLFQSPIFNNFMRFQYYWTSNADVADPASAWTVFSCDFGVYDFPRANLGYSLAVRGVLTSSRLAAQPGRRGPDL